MFRYKKKLDLQLFVKAIATDLQLLKLQVDSFMNRNECSLQVLIGTIYFTFAIFAWFEGSEGWQIFSNKRRNAMDLHV